ncbi:MAG: hypothetical protein ABSE15_05760 [Candidatus Bathyarchaeia archaeon]|jgi:hypothetical protein
MNEDAVSNKTSRKKYLKEIVQDLDDLKKRQVPSPSLENIIFDKEKEIRFKIDLINYLTAELANTKEELELLKKRVLSTKEPH